MDLTSLRLVDKAMPMTLLDFDNEPVTSPTGEAKFFVYGTDSLAYKKLDAEMTNKRLRKLAKSRKTIANAMADITPDEQNEERLKRIAVCISGWENIYENGAVLDYSPDDAMRLVTEYAMIADQVGGVRDRSRKFYQSVIEHIAQAAAHQFRLNMVRSDGTTLKAHYDQITKTTGKPPEDAIGPEIPEWLSYVVEHYLALSQCRAVGDHSVSPIRYGDIIDYQRLYGFALEYWELQAIKAIDMAFITAYMDRDRR